MLLRPTKVLPRGDQWLYELKFDGFRGMAVKNRDDVRLLSRNQKDLTKRFSRITDAVRKLHAREAIIDGEIVCVDERGRPCFEDLQNHTPAKDPFLFFYAFDLLALNGQPLMHDPIEGRKTKLLSLLATAPPALRVSEFVDTDPATLVEFARQQRLEGIVAKRRGSIYEPGKRSGAWTKFKTYQTADFLVGGFLPSPAGAESLAVGFWRENVFRYAARLEVYLRGKARADLTRQLATRCQVACPFERVPIKRAGDTWSVGLTAEDAARFLWVKPELKVAVRFTEWTQVGVLRHAGLIGLN